MHMYMYIFVYIYAFTYLNIYMYINISINIYIYVYIHEYICIYVYLHTHKYIYKYMYRSVAAAHPEYLVYFPICCSALQCVSVRGFTLLILCVRSGARKSVACCCSMMPHPLNLMYTFQDCRKLQFVFLCFSLPWHNPNSIYILQ